MINPKLSKLFGSLDFDQIDPFNNYVYVLMNKNIFKLNIIKKGKYVNKIFIFIVGKTLTY